MKISTRCKLFFFEIMHLKITKGAKYVHFAEQKIHMNFWKKFFPQPDTFWSFQLKIWLFLISIYQKQTHCKDFDSKSDKIRNFWLKIWHVVNFLLQGQTHCSYAKSKPDRWKKVWSKIWQVVKFVNQSMHVVTFSYKIWHFVIFLFQNVTPGGILESKPDTL